MADWLDDNFVAVLALLVSASHISWQAHKHWAQRARLSIHPAMLPTDDKSPLMMRINIKNVGFLPVVIVDWGVEEVEKPSSFRTRWVFKRRPRKSLRGFPVFVDMNREVYTPVMLNPGEPRTLDCEPFTLDGIMGEVWVKDGEGKIYTHLRTHLDLSGRRWPAVRYAALRWRKRLPILNRS